jgi:AraC family transcriptional regulator, regulatory protein of adaptative response / methylated-DNA-[protein]-cysteine methyltransferase
MTGKNSPQQTVDYLRIERAITFLQSNHRQQPELKDVARSIHLSEYHFQRLFSRWAAISPKKFLQYLTVEHAKRVLRESRSVLDATYETGLSSPGRLHDLFVTVEAMTPGEFKNEGTGLTIEYGFHPTPFGECLLAATQRGICGLSFVSPGTKTEVLAELRERWSGAKIREDAASTKTYAERLFSKTIRNRRKPLPLLLKGTNFQIRVWEALMRIPEGSIVSYEDIARAIGNPKASRAVGSAIGLNPVAYIIPCHRVIQRAGVIGNYHWGAARKTALLGWEWAKTETMKSRVA